MPLTAAQSERLFDALLTKGWRWRRGGALVAPSGGIWLSRDCPWIGDVHDFRERMAGRLRRLAARRHHFYSAADFENTLGETRDLVAVLESMSTR